MTKIDPAAWRPPSQTSGAEKADTKADIAQAPVPWWQEWGQRLTSRKFDLTIAAILYLILQQLGTLPHTASLDVAVVVLTGIYNVVEGLPDAIERNNRTKGNT